MPHMPRLSSYGSNISTRWQTQVFGWEDLPSPMDLADDPGLQNFCPGCEIDFIPLHWSVSQSQTSHTFFFWLIFFGF
jgi:hypothetical protein